MDMQGHSEAACLHSEGFNVQSEGIARNQRASHAFRGPCDHPCAHPYAQICGHLEGGARMQSASHASKETAHAQPVVHP
eukprot:1145176-Pelagomonas_calceolata.AAC.2